MQEDYLHYLWEFQKWKDLSLTTYDGSPLTVLAAGTHNFLSGPDFFNARIVIDGQEWAGNIEIHIKASDWYRHTHHEDPAYDSVILHVVWEHDAEVYRQNNTVIPVLELKKFVQNDTLEKYDDLLTRGRKWINCEYDFPSFTDFEMENWLERLYIERLEQKSVLIERLWENASGNWEETLFKMLAKNFGLNINGDAFLGIAASIPFSVVRKCRGDKNRLEALLMGQAGLLENELEVPYFKKLQVDYHFLRNKFQLQKADICVRYFRLRPDNFPEIRLSQLAAVYQEQPSLFSEVLKADGLDSLRKLFISEASDFWNTHYTFSKPHSARKKQLTKSFIDLLIINTLIPLKFLYFKKMAQTEKEENLLETMRLIQNESNTTINRFNAMRQNTAVSALQSQALLQMKKEYCDKNRCLNCRLGLNILKGQARI